MGLQETLTQWRAEGKLDAEYARLERILENRKFTKDQIAHCFEAMVPVLVAAHHPNKEVTLEALKQTVGEVLTDELLVIEMCGGLVHDQTRPEGELAEDLQRATANALWQQK